MSYTPVMSSVTFPDIGLKPRQALAAARRAEQEGKSPAEYLRSLVERDLLAGGSFDEVLKPLRRAFPRGGVGEEEFRVKS
jgi:hypothetical protein